MRRPLQLASWLALAGIVLPPMLYFNGTMTHDGVKTVTLVATVLWFAATPLWMGRRSPS
jgi:hypothetical protein